MLIEMKVSGLTIDPITYTPIVILKDLLASKHLQPTLKTQVEKTLADLGQFQPEKGPVPAETTGNATAGAAPGQTVPVPSPAPAPSVAPVQAPASSQSTGTGTGK